MERQKIQIVAGKMLLLIGGFVFFFLFGECATAWIALRCSFGTIPIELIVEEGQ